MKTGKMKMTQPGPATRCGANGDAQDDIAQTVMRLIQTRSDADALDAELGAHDGLVWAMRTATCRDLEALEAVSGGFGNQEQLDLEPGLELAGALVTALNEQFGEETSREDVFMELFPQVALGNSAVYVVAFVVAAMGFWEDVKSQVFA